MISHFPSASDVEHVRHREVLRYQNYQHYWRSRSKRSPSSWAGPRSTVTDRP